ncbi:hypothetical protein Tco_0009546 [Tanacetum coccineum]
MISRPITNKSIMLFEHIFGLLGTFNQDLLGNFVMKFQLLVLSRSARPRTALRTILRFISSSRSQVNSGPRSSTKHSPLSILISSSDTCKFTSARDELTIASFQSIDGRLVASVREFEMLEKSKELAILQKAEVCYQSRELAESRVISSELAGSPLYHDEIIIPGEFNVMAAAQGPKEESFGDLVACISCGFGQPKQEFFPVKGNFVMKFQLLVLSRSAREQLRIFALHLVFSFPNKFWSSSGVPMNFYNRNPTSFELLDLSVHDFNRIDTSTPCLVTISLKYSLANFYVLKSSRTAKKCIDLVSRSTITQIKSCPLLVPGCMEYLVAWASFIIKVLNCHKLAPKFIQYFCWSVGALGSFALSFQDELTIASFQSIDGRLVASVREFEMLEKSKELAILQKAEVCYQSRELAESRVISSELAGTDISKITRKTSKTGKHGRRELRKRERKREH